MITAVCSSTVRSALPRLFARTLTVASLSQGARVAKAVSAKRVLSVQTRSFVSVVPKLHNDFKTKSVRFYSSGSDFELKTPSMGDSIRNGTIVNWLRAPGDEVKVDDIILQIETDKITVDVRAPHAGVLKERLAEEGQVVEVGQLIARLTVGASGAKPAAKEEPKKEAPKPVQAETPAPKPAPTPAPAVKPAPAAPKASPAPAASSGAAGEGTKLVPMSRMRIRIAERMKEAQNTAAMLTTFQEADLSNLKNLREKYQDVFLKRYNTKLGFMSCFVKAAATALVESPVVNAVIEDNKVLYRDFIDISVAVATPTGLVVPVLRNCDRLNFAEIEVEIGRLGKKARDGQMTLEDMAGGTFTISNGGVYGSLMGTPILNMPQSAILGMHGIFDRPVAVNGTVQIRPMMYLALTYDHRLIDGREAVTFLRRVKEIVEDPQRLVLGL